MHNTINAVAKNNEVQFTDREINARIIGPMSTKSRIRRHVRFEPRGGPEGASVALGGIMARH